MNDILEAFLKSDRQWTRECRIKHAEYQLNKGQNIEFWKAVLDANKDEEIG